MSFTSLIFLYLLFPGSMTLGCPFGLTEGICCKWSIYRFPRRGSPGLFPHPPLSFHRPLAESSSVEPRLGLVTQTPVSDHSGVRRQGSGRQTETTCLDLPRHTPRYWYWYWFPTAPSRYRSGDGGGRRNWPGSVLSDGRCYLCPGAGRSVGPAPDKDREMGPRNSNGTANWGRARAPLIWEHEMKNILRHFWDTGLT